MRREGSYVSGVLWAILATALWGATFLGPAAVAPVGPIYLVLGRYVVFGILSVILLAINRHQVKSMGPRRVFVAMHLGVVGYIGFYLFFSFAAALGGGALASIATGAMPAVITIVSNLLRKELRWRVLALPLAITTSGLLVLNTRPAGDGEGGTTTDVIGATLLAIAACVVWSYFVVVNGRLIKQLDVAVVSNTTWTALIGTGAFVASIALVPFAAAGGGADPRDDTNTLIRFVIVSVLLATLGSWSASWSWNKATTRLSTVVMGQLIAMETLFGAAFNLLWEGRWPTATELLGAALVTTGVLWCVFMFERNRASKRRITYQDASSG